MFFGLDGALLTATSVRSSLSVERVSGSVEDSSEDSATTRGEGRGREFRFISRISSFRYVPFFLGAPPFCSPLKRLVKYGMISCEQAADFARNELSRRRTFSNEHYLVRETCPFLASLES